MKLTTNLIVENLLKNEKWTSQFDTPQLRKYLTNVLLLMIYGNRER